MHNADLFEYLPTKMDLTDDMLQAAINKAIEAGLLPKYARKQDAVAEREVMKLVLQAALNAGGAGQRHHVQDVLERDRC